MNQHFKTFLLLVLLIGISSSVYSQLIIKPALPDTAGTIVGSPRICPGASGIEYMVSPVDNATGYVWTLPDGATITSGDNTNTIVVDFSSEIITGYISVYGTNDTGSGESSPLLAINSYLLPANLGEATGTIPNLLDSLKAWYPFNGNAKDESGNENHGVEIFGGVSFAEGKFGQAAKFVGYDNPGHIKVNNSPSLQFASEASFAVWIRLDDSIGMGVYGQYSMNGVHSIIAKDHDRHGYFEVIYYTHIKKLQTWAGTNFNGLVIDSQKDREYTIGEWIHITYVYSDSSSSVYINGLIDSVSSKVANFSISNSHDLYFGKFIDYWYPLNGALDDLRIYNRDLSAEEVACLYNGDCSTLKLSASLPENSLCKGGSTSLTLFNAQPGVNYQLFKDANPYGNFQTGNSDTLKFYINDLYETASFTVLATDTTTGCSITLDSTFVVEVKDVSAIAIANMHSAYIPATVEVSAQAAGASTYEWLLDGVKFADTPESQIVIDSTGTHTLVLLVSSGPPDYCTDADTLFLTTTERTEVILEIPSSFTPNADGINDYFEFLTEGIDSYTVWLKDIWGVLVYEYDQATGKWDGMTRSGKEALAGPYYYNLSARDYKGQALERSGVVYLIRDLIELSPNPAKDKLVIKMNGRLPGERSVRIVSANGAVVADQILPGQNECQLDISWLKSGFYLLVINNG
ncbi:MAG: hypothetical protein FD170_1951, partial [Bacteroidetes bacterium]